MPEYQENPSFWPISGNFLINLPDFCNFTRFSPVYDSCKGEPGSSCVYRSENIKNQKEFVHLMCGNIKKPHHFGRFRVIFSQINLIFTILTGLILSIMVVKESLVVHVLTEMKISKDKRSLFI